MSQCLTSYPRPWCWLVLVLAWASGTSALHASESTKAERRPNIVFILADDLGWSDLGCYGSKFYATPNLDRLARQGMRFTSAYAAAPICSPTRASILTGKYPARVRLTDFLGGKRWPETSPLQQVAWQQGLPINELTIAQVLREAAYATGIVGKWHLGPPPDRFGFEQVANVNLGGSPAGYFDKQGRYLTDRQTEAAEQFLEQHKDRPFFLYLAYNAVHVPLQAKKDVAARYAAKAQAQPASEPIFLKDSGCDDRQVQNHAVYAAMIESLDEGVGRIMQKLRDLGIDDQTIIIFTSDNGGLSSAEGHPTSNRPLRLGKGWLYEGGLRVPLIVCWPGRTRPGSTCEVPVISNDFYPTLLEMAGLAARPRQHLDGVSLVPLLEQKGSLDRQTLYWHYPHYSNQGGPPCGAIRHGAFKLIEFYEDGRLELYNLKEDLGERNNLAVRMPERTRELRRLLEEWRQALDAQMPQRKQ